MSFDAQNPYQASGSPGSPYPRGTMEYGRMVSQVFENPNWLVNLLMMGVCQLIPVVGPLVLIGYQFEVVEALHRAAQNRDSRRTYPDFDFGRFVDYLVRGLWPFLVGLVASVVVVPIMMMLSFLMMFIMIAAVGGAAEGNAGAALFTFLPVTFLGIMVLSLAIQLLMIPLQLRAGLAQDFAAAFDFSFFKRFLATVWKECLIGMLFLMVVAIGAMLVGMAMCFIGVLFTTGVVYLAQAHFHFQLYELYLDRGGDPVPLKEPKPPTMPGPLQMPQPRP